MNTVSAAKRKIVKASAKKVKKVRRRAANNLKTAGQPAGRMAKRARQAGGIDHDWEQDAARAFERVPPLPRTHLSAKQLREFRGLLIAKRKELEGDVRRLSDEAFNRKGDGSGDSSSMPIHMADQGSDNWEQDFTIGLIANEEALVREIDAALERIDARTYGICLATHNKISLARLRAKPWAEYCIEYARAREEGRA